MLARLGVLSLLITASGPALSQSENVTKCYVRQSNGVVIVSNGQSSAQHCHDIAVKCTGRSDVATVYSNAPAIIHQSYTICTAL